MSLLISNRSNFLYNWHPKHRSTWLRHCIQWFDIFIVILLRLLDFITILLHKWVIWGEILCPSDWNLRECWVQLFQYAQWLLHFIPVKEWFCTPEDSLSPLVSWDEWIITRFFKKFISETVDLLPAVGVVQDLKVLQPGCDVLLGSVV